jgi:hypothetical protein
MSCPFSFSFSFAFCVVDVVEILPLALPLALVLISIVILVLVVCLILVWICASISVSGERGVVFIRPLETPRRIAVDGVGTSRAEDEVASGTAVDAVADSVLLEMTVKERSPNTADPVLR